MDTTNHGGAADDTTNRTQTVSAIGDVPANCSQYVVRTTTRLQTYTCKCGEFFADRASFVAHQQSTAKPIATVEYFDVAHAGPGWYWHSSLTDDAVGPFATCSLAAMAAHDAGCRFESVSSELPLTVVLATLGYTTSAGMFATKTILRDGVAVFAGNASAVWGWLGVTGQVPDVDLASHVPSWMTEDEYRREVATVAAEFAAKAAA